MKMNTDSSEPAVDWDFDLDNIDFDSWFEDQLAEALNNSNVDATSINTNNPSQPSTPSINGDTHLIGESSNVTEQNMNQNQLQLQQATGTADYLISGGGQQQGNNIYAHFLDPVGFATPDQFTSATAYHQYVLRQIKIMKERYNNELLKMHYHVMELRSRATNIEDSQYYETVMTYLEKIMTFLNISRADSLPQDDQMIYNTMNIIVNYVSCYIHKPGCYSQLREPTHQPLGAMMLQNNPSPSPTQRVTNLDANMWNFNHNFPSRRPHSQPSQSRILPSSINITSYQTARHPSVLSTTQQMNLGPMSSGVNASSYPFSLFSNTTATNFPSRPLNYQRPVGNQNFNFGKMKAPLHQTNQSTGSKARHGMSPLCSGLENQRSFPSTVNPIPQQTSTSKFGVNSVLSPHSTARSPFLPSSNSSGPSKTPMDPPSQVPGASKDQALHLTEVVKTINSNALISSLTDISSIEKVNNIIPDCVPPNLVSTHIHETNVTLEYDHESLQKRKRELSVPLVYSDPFVSQGRDICLTETSANKRKKIEKKSAIFEEIKEINRKLLETSIDAVIKPSEDDINILGAHEGTIVKCLFRNVCSLLAPQKGASSEKMPEFVILLLVPDSYPASSPLVIKSSLDVLNNEPWGTLYDEMLNKFNLSLCGITGIASLGDMARNWDASARAVVTEFLEKRGGKSFSDRYGSWDNCMKSSSSSN